MSKAAKLLMELIALPSVNPAFLPPGDIRAGEQRVADFLAVTAARAGLEVDFQKVLPGRVNLLARLRPPGRVRQTVLLAPHLDTVPASAEAQFWPASRSGRIFGRGACDTKGSVAAMLAALCDLANSGGRPRETEILFAGLVDEESGQAGSRALAKSGLKADLAIVGEPTRLKVVTAHKGNCWLQLETRGRAAHASRPELGRNAVHAMARIVDALESGYAARLRRRRHRLLGCATINVGTIQGGMQPNIVPDRCLITIDRRLLPGETEAGARREISSFLRSRDLHARFSSARNLPCRPLETDANLPWVRHFLRAVGQRRAAGIHYFCDAAVLAEGGIPSVVFGPGDIAQAHTADEWISIRQLEGARNMLVNYFKSLP